MKTLLKTSIFAAFASCSLITSAMANPGTNAVYLNIVQASNDVSRVIHVLPEVEKLWPKEPKAYFESVNKVVQVLGESMRNTSSKQTEQALVNVFTNMIQKPLPQDNGDAAVCVELKQNAIYRCLNFKEMREDKARWVEIAKFIGEVRSRMIPNYQNRTVMNSIANVSPQELQQMKIEHQQNSAMDSLQLNLRRVDSGLMWSLQNITGRFPPNKSANTNFFAQIVSVAGLTDNEAAQLRGEKAP